MNIRNVGDGSQLAVSATVRFHILVLELCVPGKQMYFSRNLHAVLSVVSDSATPWTVAQQAPLAMGVSRQEYRSGLPFPSPGDLPDPGIEEHLLCLLHWQEDSLPQHHQESPI